MNANDRQHLEDQLLLRSTGELPPADSNDLDPEAAAFAKFIEQDLPTAARAPIDFASIAIAAAHESPAPRDFAAQAIATAMPKRKPITRLWTMAAAAAVLIMGALTLQLTHHPDTQVATVTARTTVAISERLTDLEAELTTARSRYTHSRYATSTL